MSDKYAIHEVLHLASVFGDTLDTHLLQHPVVQNDKKLKAAMENIVDDLAGFYLLIGEKAFKDE